MLRAERLKATLGVLGRNWKFVTGFVLLLLIILVGLSPSVLRVPYPQFGSVPSFRQPSAQYPLGTDGLGRDLLVVLLYSTQTSLYIGFLAGTFGTLLGLVVGLLGGYKGGLVDDFLRSLIDIFLVIPLWPILILISAAVKSLTIPIMAGLLAVFSWPGSARTIRAQTMSLKEREFISIARLSGQGTGEIVFTEIFPNMLPFVGAGFVMSVTGAILAEVSLEVIGLGPPKATSIGLMLYWAQQYSATVKGWWWWSIPPITVLVLIFIALYLIITGFDEISNPRMRKL
jgi:peptide/nickel transport system permease protein